MGKQDIAEASDVSITSDNPFSVARARLKLSQRELAEKLNTSFYALVRWERGDLAPNEAMLQQLDAILKSEESPEFGHAHQLQYVTFASSGAPPRPQPLPLFHQDTVHLLDIPRPSILDGIYTDYLWGNSDLALSDILQRRERPAPTRDSALDEEVSAGKNTYTYDAHTYHTKVPPQGIAAVIAKYLPEGGVVFDPFGGSGMTGVAARYLGYDVIINELSPAASFIAYNFMRTVDIDEFQVAVSEVLANLTTLREQLYSTRCRECGKPVEQLYTVWSYVLECNHCKSTFVLWEHCRRYGRNVREHKLLREFPCPHCGIKVNKSYLRRHDTVPVFVGYKCCSKQIVEHPLDDTDLQNISNARQLLTGYADYFPDSPLPDGVNLNQPKRHGLDTIAKLYTERNLTACAAIWREIRRIEDPDLAAALGFVFTSMYQRVTRLSEYRFWGGSGNTANFNVPQIYNETNVFVTFQRKAKSIADHFYTTAQSYRGRSAIRTGSATDLSFLPDNSVDFIFTDPPFGANINYSEMNILWESWLGTFTDTEYEAIINKHQNKDLDAYQTLMSESLAEAYRVLRPGHWMVLVFMNSSEKVWRSLHEAIIGAGFTIENINIFDKQHGTFKQFVSDNTAGADLMIHCKKGMSAPVQRMRENRTVQRVADFIESEGEQIPVMPFLHVNREAEIDYRTLYSRYIAKAIGSDLGIVDFASFRREAIKVLGRNQ